MAAMRLLAGTSGYSYPEWRGSFYPDDAKPADMLRLYAERLPTVEVNNTFYRMPKREVVARWAETVPETFRFSIKASRRITHMKRLRECAEPLQFLQEVLEPLGEKLGAVLFQLPPSMKADRDRLAAFLAEPFALPAAFEFRHESWNEPWVDDLLAEHGRARCVAETEEGTTPFSRDGELGYLRLRREDLGDADVAAWAECLRGTSWKTALAYFKHESIGPHLAARLMAEFDSGA